MMRFSEKLSHDVHQISPIMNEIFAFVRSSINHKYNAFATKITGRIKSYSVICTNTSCCKKERKNHSLMKIFKTKAIMLN